MSLLHSKKGFFLLLVLLILSGISIWAVQTQRLELRKKAADTEQGNCLPVNNVITVGITDTTSTCHDLQRAIDHVNGPNITIRIQPGTYAIPESGNTFSINIVNKTNLLIQGDASQASKAIRLEFNGTRGGINIQNSSGSIEWMEINGRTSNGLVSIRDSSGFALRYALLSDQSAHTLDIQGGSGNKIVNTEISSSAGALEVSGSNDVTITNNIIHDANTGISLSDSSGTVAFNVIRNNRERAINLVRTQNLNVHNNTIVNNQASDPSFQAAVLSQFTIDGSTNLLFEKNIVAFNAGIGIDIKEGSGAGSYTMRSNDLFGNRQNYGTIPDLTGVNNNISADPLFGEKFCLTVGSPALFANQEFMGHRGPCSTPTPTPTISPTPTFTPTPTPPQGGITIEFKIKFSGVTGGAAQGAKVTARFVRNDINLITPPILFTHDGNGVYKATICWSRSYLPAGPGYTIILKGEKHVARKFCKQTGQIEPCVGNESITLPSGTLTSVFDFSGLPLDPGDLPPQDGKADMADFDIIKSLLTKPCSALTAQEKATADLNYNGCIDIADVFLMRKTLETRYDEN